MPPVIFPACHPDSHVGIAGFEPALSCPPDTRLRPNWAIPRVSAQRPRTPLFHYGTCFRCQAMTGRDVPVSPCLAPVDVHPDACCARPVQSIPYRVVLGLELLLRRMGAGGRLRLRLPRVRLSLAWSGRHQAQRSLDRVRFLAVPAAEVLLCPADQRLIRCIPAVDTAAVPASHRSFPFSLPEYEDRVILSVDP
jgi:hypothetical protein